MISEYIQASLAKARYEQLVDKNEYYGEIPGFAGVWANAPTLEACRDELREVLEEWLLFRIHRNLSLPEVNGLTLEIKEVA
ncbi:MAG: type II toxin-antitoxin system HicB family antitoxin [Gammaproteobacteria bacterium]